MEFGWELLLFLFFIAAFAGWVDAIAGGGGLIVLPVLLFSGLSPIQALATNKCQGFVGTLSATLTLVVKRKLPKRGLLQTMFWVGLGSALGTWLVVRIDVGFLNWLIPIMLTLTALYFLFTPNLGVSEKAPLISERLWTRLFAPVIGFYDGFFGPGTGSFFAAGRVLLRGKPLVDATVVAKPLNFTSNIVSVILFVSGGQIVWAVGVTMMLGQALGAVLGANTIFWGGARLIRTLVILVCLAMSIRQIYGLIA